MYMCFWFFITCIINRVYICRLVFGWVGSGGLLVLSITILHLGRRGERGEELVWRAT